MKSIRLAFAALLFLAACGQNNDQKTVESEQEEVTIEKVVSLNGTLTEILFDLGLGDQISGIDVTSTYPVSAMQKIPVLGHISTITAESVIGLKPNYVIGFKDEVSPDLASKLEKTGIKVMLFERTFSVDGAKKVISDVAKWAGKVEVGKKLTAKIDSDVAKLIPLKSKPSVLFVYARGAGSLMVAGDGTQMEEMIKLAGGKNAVSGFDQFKPLTPEAVLASNPDLLLMFDSGIQSLNGEKGILEIPGFSLTNAGKNNQYLGMDGLMLSGFGPRVGEALRLLNKKLSSIQ